MLILDAAAGILFTIAALSGAYALACRFSRGAGVSVRVAALFVILLWALSAALLLLSAARFFRAPAAIALAVLGAVAAHRSVAHDIDPRKQLRMDLASARAWWSSVSTPLRMLLAAGAAVLLVRTVHGLLAPSLAWDALTYHLYRPAVWAQSHGIVSTAGPDAAGYYAWFPPYGEGLWAWWLLVMRGDAANAPLALATFLLIPIACYACARALGATVLRGTAAALALAYTPAFMNFSVAVYVDNLALGLCLAGALFLIRLAKNPVSVDAALAAAAFAVLAGVKAAALPVAALGIAATMAMARSRHAAIASAAAAVLAVIPSLLTWIGTGSPVYPLTVRVGHHVIFPGNTELEYLLRGDWMAPSEISADRRLFFARMFFPWRREDGDFMNLGLGPLAIVPAVVPGAVILWRSIPTRHALAFLCIAAALTLAAVSGDSTAALRLWWGGLLGRLIGVTLAAAVLIAASWKARAATVLLCMSAAISVVATWPSGLSAADRHAFFTFLPSVIVVGVCAWLAVRLVPRARVLAGSIALVAIVASLIAVRDRFRYEFYEEAQAWNSYDVHPLDSAAMASWPAWQRLDDGARHVVAVTAGWDGIGHNWYRYPILGRRLQNRPLYVPITESGAVIDYRQQTSAAPISCDAWLQRLLASPAEFLLVLPPPPPEAGWAAGLPSILVPELELEPPGTFLYRIVRRPGTLPACNGRVKIS